MSAVLADCVFPRKQDALGQRALEHHDVELAGDSRILSLQSLSAAVAELADALDSKSNVSPAITSDCPCISVNAREQKRPL